MKKVLGIIPYILSFIVGIVGIAILNYFHLGFLHSFILGIAICIILIIINKIIIRFGRIESIETVRSPMKLYFFTSLVTSFIIAYISQHKIFDSIISTLFFMAIFNGIPFLIIFLEGSGQFLSTNTNNKKRKMSIETNDIYDKFGNRIGYSTSFDDGIVKTTTTKNNMGNVVAESTTVDNHTKTKINTTGRY